MQNRKTFSGESGLGSLDFPGDLVGESVCENGGTEGVREPGILPAHVPVVALSRSPTSVGTKSTDGRKHSCNFQ